MHIFSIVISMFLCRCMGEMVLFFGIETVAMKSCACSPFHLNEIQRNNWMQIAYGLFRDSNVHVAIQRLQTVHKCLCVWMCIGGKIQQKTMLFNDDANSCWHLNFIASLYFECVMKKVKIGSLSAPTIDATVVCYFFCWFSLRQIRVCCIFFDRSYGKCCKSRIIHFDWIEHTT